LCPAMTSGSASAAISTPLARADNLDVVGLRKREARPFAARDDGAVDGDGEIARRRVDATGGEQLAQGPRQGPRRAILDLAIDAHGSILLSGCETGDTEWLDGGGHLAGQDECCDRGGGRRRQQDAV